MKKERTSVASWRKGGEMRDARRETRDARLVQKGENEAKRKRGEKAYTYTRQEGSTSKERGEKRERIESERHRSWN
jgi:hypothetical protein